MAKVASGHSGHSNWARVTLADFRFCVFSLMIIHLHNECRLLSTWPGFPQTRSDDPTFVELQLFVFTGSCLLPKRTYSAIFWSVCWWFNVLLSIVCIYGCGGGIFHSEHKKTIVPETCKLRVAIDSQMFFKDIWTCINWHPLEVGCYILQKVTFKISN